uniref:Gypsy retrotransposon integrase-like protein 1 n=1 Tax=Nothobranchius furzeri TaxID=105023 RepID=A0A8C6NS12_NOTFU
MLGRWVFVYLDDILIYSRTAEEHIWHVRVVLSRLLNHNLYCKLEKCAFHQESTSFLGFTISSRGLKMDTQKVQAVAQWPLPTTLKQLQSFLGFSNFYRRFIRNFSSLAAPLTSLTKATNQPRPFRLTPEAVCAFHDLVGRFVKEPILLHPDLTRPFVMEVDASDMGAGAILSQLGPDSKLHPCTYFSRKFSPTQQNYGVGDRELLAIKLALEEWRQWLLGTTDPFLIWTDHQNLIHLQTAHQLNPRQARWALFFEPYNFHIAYRPGSKNLKADDLSRRFAPDSSPPEPLTILPAQRFLASLQWPLEQSIRAALPGDPAPPETPPNCLCVPTSCRREALTWGHCSRLAGHQGQARTLQFLRRALWWPSMRKDVCEFTAACDVCAGSKSSNQPGAGDLQPLPVPKRPWSHIGLDFVTGLPAVDHLDTILTITDRFSKAVHLVALAGLPTAKRTAELLLEEVVWLHGFPQDVVSDRGPQFVSCFWKAFCRLVGASTSLSSGYHPQTNGQTERANQQLGRYLRCFASSQPTTWPRFLLWAELSHNLQTSSATSLSPFETCYGYQPPLFDHQVPELEVAAAHTLVRCCRLAWIRACAAITWNNTEYSRQHHRRHWPGPVIRSGDQVWLSSANLRMPAGSRKLDPRFLGPYPVLRVINPVTYRLRLPAALRIHPVFHVSQLKPVVSSPLHPPLTLVPPPHCVEEDRVYTVRKILDAHHRGCGWQYLVDWEGYCPEERSWEPARSFVDPALLADFWARRPGSSGAVPLKLCDCTSCVALSNLTLCVHRSLSLSLSLSLLSPGPRGKLWSHWLIPAIMCQSRQFGGWELH